MDTEALARFRRCNPDEMINLYKKDPALFNELAADLISQACIGKTEEGTLHLRQMQWVIDGELRKGKTPLQRMHIMENIFYSRIFGDDGQLAQLCRGWSDLIGDLTQLEQIGINRKLRVLKERDTQNTASGIGCV